MQNLVFTQLSVPEVRQIFREEIESFFKNFPINQKNEDDKIGSIDLAMEVTGLAKATIYSLCSDRKIPHFKKGKSLYFSRRDLLRWLRDGKRKTQAEIQAETNQRI